VDCVFDSVADFVAAQAPDEPVYCVRPHALRTAAAAFTAAFPGDVLYAVKCNDDPAVLQALWQGGVRHFDAASLPEIAAVEGAFGPGRARFMNPVKSRGAIAAAYHRHGMRCFALDHAGELEKIRDVAERPAGGAGELLLMVRLAVTTEGAMLKLDGKFGASPGEAADLLRLIVGAGAAAGLTFHVGSQCLDPGAYRRAIALAADVRHRAGVPVAVLDVGGGFPVPYDGLAPPPTDAFVEEIAEAAGEHGFLPDTRLWCEPGRALVAEGCSVLARVVLRRDDAVFLNDGVYGSLYDMKHQGLRYPTRLVRADGIVEGDAASARPFRLFGPSCDSFDSLPGTVSLPDSLREGDWIEFGQTGAYARALRTGFNGFYPQATALLADDGPQPAPAEDAALAMAEAA
jgi:ornithine decarboxylase